MPKQNKKFDAEALATKGALWLSDDLNEKYLSQGATMITMSLIGRVAIRKAIETLGYDKKTAKTLRNGLMSLPWAIGASGYLGIHAARKWTELDKAKSVADAQKKAEKGTVKVADTTFGDGMKMPTEVEITEVLDAIFNPKRARPSAPPANPKRRPQQNG